MSEQEASVRMRMAMDEYREALQTAGPDTPGWNKRLLAALRLAGYGLLSMDDAQALGLLGPWETPLYAPRPREGCPDDPPYDNPSVIVPLSIATRTGDLFAWP